MKSLYQKVHEAYGNALQNSFNLDLLKPEAIAADMQDCDGELENESYEHIVECVKKIQNMRKLNG